MKCPKCSYLGFETGDRCKNCGYDFSLLAADLPATPDPDLMIRDEAETAAPEIFLDRLDRSMDEAGPLPLFNPDDPDDAPLIALPAAPRPPLAVRRTPDTPRLRAVPRLARRVEPVLNFREEIEGEIAGEPSRSITPPPQRRTRAIEGTREVGGRRLVAAVIDHSILLAIDLCVVYFTLRMAGLDADAIRALPAAPLMTFLALVKVAYFTAFTAVGGQTIGKMTVGIRVIAEHGEVDGARAIRRTFAGILSLLPLGLGFLPAFFGSDRRALHDRLTQTRVVGLPSA